MKRLGGRIVLLLLAAILPVTGCSDPRRGSNVDSIKIGVTVYRQDDTFITSVREYIEEAAKLRETQDNVRITINVMDSQNNQSIQNDHVDKFVSKGYDVICVNEVDRTAASLNIDKARAANTPMIFFNREPVGEDMQRWDRLYYVGSNPEDSGVMQGQIVVDAMKRNAALFDQNGDGKLQYIMLEGEPGHQDAAIRTEFTVKTIIKSGIMLEKLANDTANWQRGEASTKMSQWIERYGDSIEAVFSNNDDMALGVIDAYQAADIQDLPMIVGIDGTRPALEALAAGTLSGTVINDAKGQGYTIFEIAYSLATGQDPALTVPLLDGQYAWLPHTIVTKDTLPKNLP